jgi:hypothetical protein
LRLKKRLLTNGRGPKEARIRAWWLTPLLASACLVALALPAVSAAATKPPSITSSFVPNLIPVGETTSLSYTITNPNASGTLSQVYFTDTLPNGVLVENPNGESGSCGSASVITATSGGNTISLYGGSVKAGATCTFSVDVTSNAPAVYKNSTGTVGSSNGGSGNSDTESLTIVAPPTLTVNTPHNNATYNFGQRVVTSFSCAEAANGPGITDCSGDVDGSDNDLNSGSTLPTSSAGAHTFTISAISGDGAITTDTINYKVRPSNRFTVSHVKASSSGSVSYQIKLPGPGRVAVRELAGKTVIGAKTFKLGHAGKFTFTVPPGSNGAAALASGQSIAAQITFTPKGGQARKVTVHGIRAT